MSKHTTYSVIVKTSGEWHGTVSAASKRAATELAKTLFDAGSLQQSGEETEDIIVFKQRRRIGSWTTFERRFEPKDSPDGSVWWSREQLPIDIAPRHVWTIVDCDGKLYVSPGFHFVNRLDYVLCDVPWTDEDLRQPDYRYD